MTKTYHKEPMVIQAMKLENFDESITEALNFIGETNFPFFDRGKSFESLITAAKTLGGIKVNGQNATTEGLVLAEFGNYIAKNDNGTFYVVSAELFEKYYHEVKEEN